MLDAITRIGNNARKLGGEGGRTESKYRGLEGLAKGCNLDFGCDGSRTTVV
jgi:hypothetical protein